MGAVKELNYKKVIEKLLLRYPLYKKSLQDEEKGVISLLPSLTPPYGQERVKGGKSDYISTSEKFGVKRAERRLAVEQVESCLEMLDEEERKLIEEAYFYYPNLQMEAIYSHLNCSKSKYYRTRDKAFYKMAIMLNLI
jgi:ArpU family phage transcriptional regulator